MIPCPVIEAMVPPTATATQTQPSDQTGPQQPFSGAVAGVQPATTSYDACDVIAG